MGIAVDRNVGCFGQRRAKGRSQARAEIRRQVYVDHAGHAALGLVGADLAVVRLLGALVLEDEDLTLVILDSVLASLDALHLEHALGAAQLTLDGGLGGLLGVLVLGAGNHDHGQDDRQAEQRLERSLHR